jgi:hypothetical protein
MQTHSKSAFKFSSQTSEEHNESRNIKEDLVVTSEPWFIEPKIVFNVANGCDEAKSAAVIPTITFAKSTTHFGEITNLTFSHMIAKHERTNLVVKIGMEGKTLVLAQPEPIATLIIIRPLISYYNYRSKNRC